jgi:drug/metabolite transporter (DMT)-like permease
MLFAYLEIIFATVIWGFGFIASIWALEGIGPIWQTGVRFLFAGVMLDLIFRTRLFGLAPIQYGWNEFKKVFRPGLCLFGLIAFQTWGLKYTTATRSGFITVLYVLFVPLFQTFVVKTRHHRSLWIWLTLAVLGTALICGAVNESGIAPGFFSAFNKGDFLCFICAIFAAGHILTINKVVNDFDSPIRFHIYQCIWVGLMASVIGTFTEGFDWVSTPWSPKVWLGLIELSVFSSSIAFLIQVRVQRIINPTTLSLLLLLESPWAMLFSILVEKESILPLQYLGAALILVAASAESYSAARRA